MLLVWIFGSLQFGISVEVADICADPEGATIQAVSSGFDGSGELNDTLAILEYYVYCDEEHQDNPLTDTVADTQNILANVSSTMDELVTYANQINTTYTSDVNALSRTFDKAINQTSNLADNLDCEAINGYYNDILDSFCFDLLPAWHALYVTQWVTVGLLLLRMCFVCKTNSWAD